MYMLISRNYKQKYLKVKYDYSILKFLNRYMDKLNPNNKDSYDTLIKLLKNEEIVSILENRSSLCITTSNYFFKVTGYQMDFMDSLPKRIKPHKNFVNIIDYLHDTNLCYIKTEKLEEVTKLTSYDTSKIIQDIGCALQHLHEEGYVHKDIYK